MDMAILVFGYGICKMYESKFITQSNCKYNQNTQ